MKKYLALLLVLVLTLSLAACQEAKPNTTTTQPSVNTPTETGDGTTPVSITAYSFDANGVTLVPGAAFEIGSLPEAASVFEVPSCAIEGTDLLYNYETFELTAYNDGSGPVIYSVFLVDANITTPEGLAIGDSTARVTELYGSNCEIVDNQITYTAGDTLLIILTQDDFVTSIEYRMA